MRIVADRLKDWATQEQNLDHADSFGRSAFNRYYYAAFLITREMLKKLNPEWARAGHGNIPSILQNTITKNVQREIKKAAKRNLINAGEASSLRHSLSVAVSELSGLLSLGYSVRVIADYEPEVRIVREGKSISLDEQTLDAAKAWPDRAGIFSKTILKIWSNLGLS